MCANTRVSALSGLRGDSAAKGEKRRFTTLYNTPPFAERRKGCTHMAKIRQTGSVFNNHGYWYYSVQLPGERKRRQVPLKAPGAKHAMTSDRPRKMAEEAAARYWEERVGGLRRGETVGMGVDELCAAWAEHCHEYYRRADGSETSAVTNCIIGVRMFRDLYGGMSVAELTHADMLRLRDALVRSGISRGTVNRRLWVTRHMLDWALDEALIPAQVKAELTQVKNLKRGRSAARETAPVRPVGDEAIRQAIAHMVPNTADMVRVHRWTGMRPCELCAMRWADIDESMTPWVYRVPDVANKNAWRGEVGQPRVVCIGPKARAVLERHRGAEYPFSPAQAMAEHMRERREARVTPRYGAESRETREKGSRSAPHVPRVLGVRWCTTAYTRTIRAACERAGIDVWSANQVRHTFGTEVRRRFGLEAARAVLGHTRGGCVTDIYSYDAIEDEMVRIAAPVVEALG